MRRIVSVFLCLAFAIAFFALTVWQIQRSEWKGRLIADVNTRTAAEPVAAPDASDWGELTKSKDEYRRVIITGRYLHASEVQVYALTERGAGYWVLTPLKTKGNEIVFINRGYVPTDKKQPATRGEGQVESNVTVTGLLRMSEQKGWLFSQANDPAHNLWYHRDISAISKRLNLSPAAPFFIDADATPNPGGLPIGGMTVIRFANSHLVYAFTWFALALMSLGAALLIWRQPTNKDSAA